MCMYGGLGAATGVGPWVTGAACPQNQKLQQVRGARHCLITSQQNTGEPVRRVAGLGARFWRSPKSASDARETRRSELAYQRDQEGQANP